MTTSKVRRRKTALPKEESTPPEVVEESTPPKVVRSAEKPEHRVVSQTFTARMYAAMRRLPAGAEHALLDAAGDRRHRTEVEWRKFWKTITSRRV